MHCGAHWQFACGIAIGCIGAAMGCIYCGCCTYGVPNATGEPIIAGAAVFVPQIDPRWSQLRQLLQQPELAAVKADNASAINTFTLMGVSSAGHPWRVMCGGELRTG